MGALKPQCNGPYSNMVIGTLAIDGWAVTFSTARSSLGGPWPRPVPSLLYPSMASVPTSYYSMWHYNCLWINSKGLKVWYVDWGLSWAQSRGHHPPDDCVINPAVYWHYFLSPVITFPAAQHHLPLASTKLYCMVTEAHGVNNLLRVITW